MTIRQQTRKIVHVAAVQPGHTLCGIVFDVNTSPKLIPLVGMATQDEVIHLQNICPKCKETVKPQRCKLIISVRWHDCGHCQGPEGHFCNGTLTDHREGKYEHEFQKEEFWTDEMREKSRKLNT